MEVCLPLLNPRFDAKLSLEAEAAHLHPSNRPHHQVAANAAEVASEPALSIEEIPEAANQEASGIDDQPPEGSALVPALFPDEFRPIKPGSTQINNQDPINYLCDQAFLATSGEQELALTATSPDSAARAIYDAIYHAFDMSAPLLSNPVSGAYIWNPNPPADREALNRLFARSFRITM
jgi:hypothetical protein